eukprot:2995559-Pleurochrysis_carterae.AAC.2
MRANASGRNALNVNTHTDDPVPKRKRKHGKAGGGQTHWMHASRRESAVWHCRGQHGEELKMPICSRSCLSHAGGAILADACKRVCVHARSGERIGMHAYVLRPCMHAYVLHTCTYARVPMCVRACNLVPVHSCRQVLTRVLRSKRAMMQHTRVRMHAYACMQACICMDGRASSCRAFSFFMSSIERRTRYLSLVCSSERLTAASRSSHTSCERARTGTQREAKEIGAVAQNWQQVGLRNMGGKEALEDIQ